MIIQSPYHKCKYCGADSWIDPTDQCPPSDYCHESDHGEPDDEFDDSEPGSYIL